MLTVLFALLQNILQNSVKNTCLKFITIYLIFTLPDVSEIPEADWAVLQPMKKDFQDSPSDRFMTVEE